MKPFLPGQNPEVLLLGNGIHKTYSHESWDALLRKMNPDMEKDLWDQVSKLPYPLMAVVAAKDHLNDCMKSEGRYMTEQHIEQKEANMLRKILNCGFDTVLTTNYTYDIEQALCPEFNARFASPCKFRNKTCKDKPAGETSALYQYMNIPTKENTLPVWHIHGEAARADSMIIGHYYYGKLLSQIKQYASESIRRYKTALRQNEEFYPRSWVDYFLYGNVSILGQGLHFSEMDLWWLINCKKRNGSGKITWYEPNIKTENRMLAEAYNVIIKTETVGPDEFENYYNTMLDSFVVKQRSTNE